MIIAFLEVRDMKLGLSLIFGDRFILILDFWIGKISF